MTEQLREPKRSALPPVEVVLVASSLGGVQALRKLLSLLPADFPVPIVIVQHRSEQLPNRLTEVLARSTRLKVMTIVPDNALEPGTVYIAPPNRHVTITGGHRLALMDGRRIKHVLSSADPLFESAAQSFGPRVVAVILTGTDSDGAHGARAVKDAGGTVLVQDEATCQSFEMPKAAIRAGAVDAVLPLDEIAPALVRLVNARNP